MKNDGQAQSYLTAVLRSGGGPLVIKVMSEYGHSDRAARCRTLENSHETIGQLREFSFSAEYLNCDTAKVFDLRRSPLS